MRRNPEKYPYNGWDKPLTGLDEWVEKIHEQACKKFGVDSDGDCPVNIRVIDRTKFAPDHWWSVPYEHEAKTMDQLDKVEDMIARNLDIAIEAYRKFRQMKKHRHLSINNTAT